MFVVDMDLSMYRGRDLCSGVALSLKEGENAGERTLEVSSSVWWGKQIKDGKNHSATHATHLHRLHP